MMDTYLKPACFSTEHSTPTAAKEWKHWLRTFKNFLEAVKKKGDGGAVDKLEILTNYISAGVFEYIEQCTTYEKAIETLTFLYIKPTNEIFARHKLATRKQQTGETLDDYIHALRLLSKDCNFTNVSAEKYTSESIRDAFISGLSSQIIRTRLLENNTLTLDNAFQQARALELAQRHSDTYRILPPTFNTAAAVSSQGGEDKWTEPNPGTVAASGSKTASHSQWNVDQKTCMFCGRDRHPREQCRARNSTCRNCLKKGHWDVVCKAPKAGVSSISQQPVEATTPWAPAMYSLGSFHPKVVQSASVNHVPARALADTGANITCISKKFADDHHLEVFQCDKVVQLAAKHTARVKGFTIADLEFQGHTYPSKALDILPDLVEEVVIGTDLMEEHDSVTIQFGGSKAPLVLNSLSHLSVTAPSLFSNLTSDCAPVAAKSRRYSAADTAFINEQVDKLLASGIIEPSHSPWRAQLLVHRSPNHKTRMVVDYSETINRFTELDAYPVPLIEDVVAEMAKYNVYTSLDAKDAYNQLLMQLLDRPYTAFQAGKGFYQFTRVPFGLRNSGAVFQRVMDTMIKGEDLKGAVFYVDNAYIGGVDQADHDRNLAKFLEASRKLNITFNVSKTVLSSNSLSILGHYICNNTIRPDPERVKPLLDLPPPNSLPEQRRVVGMFAYYSRWIAKFSEFIHPIVKNTKFPLSGEALNGFNKLKSVLAEAALQPILDNVPFTVETDASNFAIGATLNQNGKPVAFLSRTLQGSELHHSAVEKEAYSIVEALRKWHHLLYGQQFSLVTDQRSVAFMFDTRHKSTIKNAKILRWRIELSALSFNIMYRPGTENAAADAFSRVSSILNKESLKDIHSSLCHPGVTRLYHYVRSKNLPYSIEDVKAVSRNCRACAEVKPNFFRPPPTPLIKATRPFERLSIDFKGPVPSKSKNYYMLDIVDEYSRYPFAFPCPDMTSATVIKCLSQLFVMFGLPCYIHSDRGPSLISKELRTFLHSRGIATSITTPYHPQGNGQVERYNGVIWNAILLALKDRDAPTSCWEDVLMDALHSIRSLLCTATNCTPHERLFSHPRRTGLGVTLPSWLTTPGTLNYGIIDVKNIIMT